MNRWTVLAATALLALAACTAAGDPSAGDAGAGMNASPTAEAQATGPVATPPRSTMDPTATLAPDGDDCGAGKVTDFVGQEATPAVRAKLATSVGHKRIRWLGPDTAATMDYSPARLNVTLEADPARKDAGANIITGAKCG